MGSLFGRKGSNETDGRHRGVAKRSASLLAAVAVAGGSAVGMPQAEAGEFDIRFPGGTSVYEDSVPSGFSKELEDAARANLRSGERIVFRQRVEKAQVYPGEPIREDHANLACFLFGDAAAGEYKSTFARDVTFEPVGEIPVIKNRGESASGVILAREEGNSVVRAYPYELSVTRSSFIVRSCLNMHELPDYTGSLKPTQPGQSSSSSQTVGTSGMMTYSLKWTKVSDQDELPIGGSEWTIRELDGASSNVISVMDSTNEDEASAGPDNDPRPGYFSVNVKSVAFGGKATGDTEDERHRQVNDWFEQNVKNRAYHFELKEVKAPDGFVINDTPRSVTFPTGNDGIIEYGPIVNNRIPLPPPTATETITVTPPTTTVTETPKTETTTATTTESATTTVTETPKTETVTETPQRETVTLTPEKETETVTETPQKETVTETPKTETVTHTPDKETVTETPKASTETSTVTAPQVTVTETPKQVTETTTLPQKTVTEQVPTTVVENKTETVKVPPVTVTTTEKQEPTTVTATPEKVTETVKVPGEKTTVVETKLGESTTVRETVTETPKQPDVPAVVEQPTPNAPVVDTPETPVIPGAFSGTVVWDEDRSKTVNNGDERIPGLTVVGYKDGKEIVRTTTDENGFYKFDNLEPGEYGIAVYGPDGGVLFFEDKASTVVAGEEDTGNDWGFVREDAPAPVEEGKPATPVETVRMTLATTGANSYALAGLGAVLAALVALAVVSRRRTASQ